MKRGLNINYEDGRFYTYTCTKKESVEKMSEIFKIYEEGDWKSISVFGSDCTAHYNDGYVFGEGVVAQEVSAVIFRYFMMHELFPKLWKRVLKGTLKLEY